MNADIIFEEFGGIDSKYILSAEKAIQEKTAAPKPAPKPAPKRRLWQRIALAAACLALVIAMIPIGMMIGKIINPDTPTTKPSIANIPGAVYSVDDTVFDSGIGNSFYPRMSRNEKLELANTIKTKYSAVSGKVLNYTSVYVPDGDNYYRIYTFTVEIQEIFSNNGNVEVEGKQIIDIVYACRYDKRTLITQHENGEETIEIRYNVATPYYFAENRFCRIDMGATTARVCYDDQVQYPGLFQLEASTGHELTLQGETYDLSDYADYYMAGGLYYDGANAVGVPEYGSFPADWIRETPRYSAE